MHPQWERLSEEVLLRRTSKRWTQDQVWEQGGPSDTLQTEIEARRWHPKRSVRGTLQKIDAGMRWEPGSAAAILEGGDPVPVELKDADVRIRVRRGDGTWEDRERHHQSPQEILERRAAARRGVAVFGDTVINILTSVIDDDEYPVTPAEREELRGMVVSIRKIGEEFGPLFHVHSIVRAYMDEMKAILEKARTIIGSSEDGANESVTVADHWGPAPRSVDLAGATSVREQQAEREQSGDIYASQLAAALRLVTEILEDTESTPIPEIIQAVVPAERFQTYKAALAAVSESTGAVQLSVDQNALTRETVRSLLEAIDTYITAASDMISDILAVHIHATQQQIDGTLPMFKRGRALSNKMSSFIGLLIPAAPNTEEVSEIKTRQQSLHQIAELNQSAYDSFVDLGRTSDTSRPGISRVHGNVPYLTPEEFLPGGVDPTSPGDEQADHG